MLDICVHHAELAGALFVAYTKERRAAVATGTELDDLKQGVWIFI